MGLPICRIGDTGEGVCTAGGGGSHTITATVITGAATVYAEGASVARLGDFVEGNDSHQKLAMIITGSPTGYVEGLPATRIGDFFEGPKLSGILITGAATVYAI